MTYTIITLLSNLLSDKDFHFKSCSLFILLQTVAVYVRILVVPFSDTFSIANGVARIPTKIF